MVLKNLTPQWLAIVYVATVSYGINILLARKLGPAFYGEFVTAVAAGSILAVFLDAGFRKLLFREFTRSSYNLNFSLARLIDTAFGTACVLALIFCVVGVGVSPQNFILISTTISCFLGLTLAQLVSARLQGEGRFLEDAYWQASHRTLSGLLILSAIWFGLYAPWQILLGWATGTLLCLSIFSWKTRIRPSVGFHIQLYRSVGVLFLIDLATVIYFRSDIILLGYFGVDKSQIGQYAAGYRLLEAVVLILNPVTLLIFRWFRKMSPSSKTGGFVLSRAAGLALVIGAVCSLAVANFAEPIILLIYGEFYQESCDLLRILCWSLMFIFPNAVLTQAALAFELERSYAISAGVAAIFNVTANLLFIGRWGVDAVAWSTVITEAMLMFWLFSLVIRSRRSIA